MLFNLDHQPIRKLEYEVQREVGKQNIWGLGHNSDDRMNFFARFYVPPDNIVLLDFFLSLHFNRYHSHLCVRENKNGVETEIAQITLSADDKEVIRQIQSLTQDTLIHYDHNVDRSFEDKIRSIFAAACLIERKAYRRGFLAMRSIQD